MLSYSDFGSVDNNGTASLREAAARLRNDGNVDFPVDGEMEADTAIVEELVQGTYEHSELDESANAQYPLRGILAL